MSLHFESMPDDTNLQAALYGPLVLAGKLGNAGLTESAVIGPEGPEMDKHPAPEIPEFVVKDQPLLEPAGHLRFVTTGQANKIEFVPFHRLSGERYSVYWRINQTSEI